MSPFTEKVRITLYDQNWLYIAVILLVPIALLSNLGAHHLLIQTDEARRAVVSLEMLLSRDFLTPTINGAYYFNKPPLYNWLIAVFFHFFGTSLFVLRLPNVLALMVFGYVIYISLRPPLGRQIAALTALATITSFRILFFNAFLALIDITFALVVFSNFMVLYYREKKSRFLSLYIFSYTLCAIAFLLKGLPALAFQGITLLTLFIWRNRFSKLITWQHGVAILWFMLLIGLYYVPYLAELSIPWEKALITLWSESVKRTAIQHSILDTILHLFSFPLEVLYAFLPWTILSLSLLSASVRNWIWKQDFLKYSLLILLTNILLYWTSVQVFPRYLFMFVPLIFANLIAGYQYLNGKLGKLQQIILAGLLWFASLGLLATQYLTHSNINLMQVVLLGLIILLMIYFAGGATISKSHSLLYVASGLLIARLWYGVFLLPDRRPQVRSYQDIAIEMGKETSGKPLYLWKDTPIHDVSTFYLERERGEILRRVDQVKEPEAYYIVDCTEKNTRFEPVYSFSTWITDSKIAIAKKKP